MKKFYIVLTLGLLLSCKGKEVVQVVHPVDPKVPSIPSSPIMPEKPGTSTTINEFLLEPLNTLEAPKFSNSEISVLGSETVTAGENMVSYLTAFSNDTLVACSENKVFVYKKSLDKFEILQTLNEFVLNLEIKDDILVLIVPSNIPNPTSGIVYSNSMMAKVYKLENGLFVEKAILAHQDPREGDLFGFDLKITDENIVVSTPLKDAPIDCTGEAQNTIVCAYSLDPGTDEGAIFVFDKNSYELVRTFWGSQGASIGARLVVRGEEVGSMNLVVNKATYSNIITGIHYEEQTQISSIKMINDCMYRLKFEKNKIYFRPILEDKLRCAFFNINVELDALNNFNFDLDAYTLGLVKSDKILFYDFYSKNLLNFESNSGVVGKVIKAEDKLIVNSGSKISIYYLIEL